MRVQSTLALAVIASAIVACGGGGGGGTTAPQTILPGGTTVTPATTPGATTATTPPGTTSGATGSAALTVVVPRSTGSNASRRAQNVASGTQSITLQLIQTGGIPVTGVAQTYPLTSTSAGCSTVSAGLSCTFSVAAPIGDDVFTAQTFSATNGTGQLLSTGAVRITIAANATNAASVSLDGTIASIYVASSSFFLGTQGSSTINTARLFIIALDSQGNSILNPTVYNTPITLQQTFGYGYNANVALSVAAAAGGSTTTNANYGTVTVSSPSDVITATLIGGVTNGSSSDQIAAYLGAAPPAPTVTGAPSPLPSTVPHLSLSIVVPVNNPLAVSYNPWNIAGLQFTYSYISGGSGTYSISAPSCAGIVSVAVQSNYYITANPIAVGSCSATLSDTNGDTPLTIPITVTTTQVIGH